MSVSFEDIQNILMNCKIISFGVVQMVIKNHQLHFLLSRVVEIDEGRDIVLYTSERYHVLHECERP